MIFYDSDDSNKSNKSVIYNNSYDSSNHSFCSSYKEKYDNTSHNNSFKSQNYFDSVKLFTSKEIEIETKIKDNSYKSQNYIDNIKNNKFKRIQTKNHKLKYKILLCELKINKIKNDLYRSNYNLVLKDIENFELKKYYELGIIYKSFIKGLEKGVQKINIDKTECISIAKKQIKKIRDTGRNDIADKLYNYYCNEYENFKND